ncbi:hypothetical protein Tco_1509995 [Tanacetum coccineum]
MQARNISRQIDTQKVKLDLEHKVRLEQALVIQRNKRNAELVQENDLLKSTLSGKEKSIAFLQSEKEKILSEKKDLADSYLDEIVCLKNANKVARDILQRFNMPTETIPMLFKKPKMATADLHKDLLVSIWDSEEVLVQQVVSMKKMSEKPGHVRPANGFYDKLNALKFVPQQELSREQAYWLPANERASQTSNPNRPVTPYKIPIYYDDDDYEESSNTLRDIIISELPPLIKSSVEDLVLIPSKSEGISNKMCDVPFHGNSLPLDISKDQFEDFFDSNDDSTSIDDDSFSIDNIDYVEASPPNSEPVSSKVMEIVIPEVGRIEDDILLIKTIPFSTSNFLPFLGEITPLIILSESETFCFNLEEPSSGSPTTHSELSLPDYKAFYIDNDHFKEKSSGSTTTHVDFSQYDSFIFDLSNDQFPPADRSDFYHEEFADGLAHIISPPEYDRFYFKIEPELGNLTMDVDCPDCEDSQFCHSSRVSHPQLHLGIRYPNLID